MLIIFGCLSYCKIYLCIENFKFQSQIDSRACFPHLPICMYPSYSIVCRHHLVALLKLQTRPTYSDEILALLPCGSLWK